MPQRGEDGIIGHLKECREEPGFQWPKKLRIPHSLFADGPKGLFEHYRYARGNWGSTLSCRYRRPATERKRGWASSARLGLVECQARKHSDTIRLRHRMLRENRRHAHWDS